MFHTSSLLLYVWRICLSIWHVAGYVCQIWLRPFICFLATSNKISLLFHIPVSLPISHTAKKHLLFWQLHLSPELQLLTRIVPCGSQLWAVKHIWSIGKLMLLQGLGSLLRHQISAIHNKRALFPSLQRALIIIMMWTAYSYLSVTCFNQLVATLVADQLRGQWIQAVHWGPGCSTISQPQ